MAKNNLSVQVPESEARSVLTYLNAEGENRHFNLAGSSHTRLSKEENISLPCRQFTYLTVEGENIMLTLLAAHIPDYRRGKYIMLTLLAAHTPDCRREK